MDTTKLFAVTNNGTKVYTHPECHPHRLDKVAAEAISFMNIPRSPLDANDHRYTKISNEHDFGKVIGVCHLVKIENQKNTYYAKRGTREYNSHMVLQKPADESKLVTVVIWYNEKWLLMTNYEGKNENIPEPGCESFEAGTEEEQRKWRNFWYEYGLVPEEKDLKNHIEEFEAKYNDERKWLNGYWGYMSSLEWNARDRELETMKNFIAKMKIFFKEMYEK